MHSDTNSDNCVFVMSLSSFMVHSGYTLLFREGEFALSLLGILPFTRVNPSSGCDSCYAVGGCVNSFDFNFASSCMDED